MMKRYLSITSVNDSDLRIVLVIGVGIKCLTFAGLVILLLRKNKKNVIKNMKKVMD